MPTKEGDKIESKTVNFDDIDSNSAHSTGDSEKIVFLLRAAGGAPMLKRKKWALPRTKTVSHITEFLKKYMQLDTEQQKQLVLYVNQAFAPAVDTTIGAINDCFSGEGTLVLHYALTPAWG